MQIQNPASVSILAASAVSGIRPMAESPAISAEASRPPGLDALEKSDLTPDRDANEKYVSTDGNQNKSLQEKDSKAATISNNSRSNALPVAEFDLPATFEGWG